MANRLSIRHYVVTDQQDRFVKIYREGCRNLRESYDPLRHFCHPCAAFVHEIVEEHLKCFDCSKLALGITDDDFELYGIPKGAFPGVLRPDADLDAGMDGDEKRRYLDGLGILSWKDSDPIKTNCLINFLMVDCCLKWYGKHPYEDRFAHRPWLTRGVRWASKLRLFRPFLLKRLREELLVECPNDEPTLQDGDD